MLVFHLEVHVFRSEAFEAFKSDCSYCIQFHISSLQAPSIRAAVPVHTPISH